VAATVQLSACPARQLRWRLQKKSEARRTLVKKFYRYYDRINTEDEAQAKLRAELANDD